jgi:hypothetical protein
MGMFIRKKRGVILVFGYSLVLSFTVLAGVVIQRAWNEMNDARRYRRRMQALYLAEGMVEKGAYEIARAVANYSTPPNGEALANVMDKGGGGYDVQYTAEVIDSESSVHDPQGATVRVQHYLITADATDLQTGVVTTVNQVLARNKTYTFQHAVFYADDLEMFPGANMTLSGKVHSNSDIYLGSDGNTLKIATDYLYSAGDIYSWRKNNGATPSGNISVLVAGGNPADVGDYETFDRGPYVLDSNRPGWTNESQTVWGGSVKSRVHNVKEMAMPAVASTEPDGYYADNAGLVIKNGRAYNSSGVDITGSLPANTVKQTSIYNAREGRTITVTDVDMAKLNASGHFPANGLLYATDTTADSSHPDSIRLKNGCELAGPLTVVSDCPVYLQGDYNTTNKKGAAVICDAVNLLSNNWLDSRGDQSGDSFNNKMATDTAYNVAFISGIVETPDGGGNYSGGLENYPRLHERWGGKTMTIRGSFVELWTSQIARGNWKYGSPQYEAPTRNWDYDTDYNTEGNLPPFTPFVVEMERVLYWQ